MPLSALADVVADTEAEFVSVEIFCRDVRCNVANRATRWRINRAGLDLPEIKETITEIELHLAGHLHGNTSHERAGDVPVAPRRNRCGAGAVGRQRIARRLVMDPTKTNAKIRVDPTATIKNRNRGWQAADDC